MTKKGLLATLGVFLVLSISVNAGHHAAKKSSPEALVVKAYETFSTGDTAGWAALHADDLTFTINGQLPMSGVHNGTQAVIDDVFGEIPRLWPQFQLDIVNIDVSGNNVYVLLNMTAEDLDTQALHMFKVEDGQIVSFVAFDDTDSMRQAMKTE